MVIHDGESRYESSCRRIIYAGREGKCTTEQGTGGADVFTFTDFLSRTRSISDPQMECSSSAMLDLYSSSPCRAWFALFRASFFVSKLLSRKSASVSEEPPRVWLRLPMFTARECNSSSLLSSPLSTSSTEASGSWKKIGFNQFP